MKITANLPLARRVAFVALMVGIGAIANAQASGDQASGQAQPLDECEVIARINSEVILACELDWQVRLMFEQRFGPQALEMADSPMLAQARRDLLKQLVIGRIDMALLYADFRSNAPGADMASIQKQLQEPFEKTELPRLMKSLKVEDRAALDAKLRELGTSLAERREDFIRTMIAQTWIRQSVSFDKEVTHEQMLDYYHEHLDEYDQPRRVKWEELMIRFNKHASKRAAWAAMAQLGNVAHAAAQATAIGEPAFETIARVKSDGFTAEDGGGHAWTTKGSLASDEVDQALFNLPVGRMSPILEGPMGFHIVRVIDRKEAGPTPFSEVQAAIRKGLQDERSKVAINKKLDDLRQSARLWTVFTGDMSYDELAALQAGPMQR